MKHVAHPLRRAGQQFGIALACIFSLHLPLATAAQSNPDSALSDAALVQRGAYLATAGDCIACHTAQHGAPFAGGNPIASPVGTIWSTNITPSQKSGIGAYTEAQFGAALREGIRADGSHLYPAMPYTSYTLLSDDDVHALYAYFMQGVTPVDTAAPTTQLPFPFNIRAAMAGWNMLFNTDKRFSVPAGKDAEKDAQWLRGAYLAEGLAHCSTCHTPRNVAMAEDDGKAFAGAQIGSWYAPNISSDPVAGIGGWSQPALVAYLKTGRADGHALASGPMSEAIRHSFSKLTDSDLNALAVYIRSAAPMADTSVHAPAWSFGTVTSDEARIRGDMTGVESPGQMSGAQLYSGNCAACHQANGQGPVLGGAPSLLHVSAVGRQNPDNLVMTILEGAQTPGAHTSLMPAFAHELSDAEVARVATYVRQSFGDPQATPVTAAHVAALRAGPSAHAMVTRVRWLMGAGLVIVLLIIARLRRRK